MADLHFSPKTGNTTQTITIPELKEGDIVIFYGAKFEVLEDAYNCSHNELKLPNERRDLPFQAFGAKCIFMSYEDGSPKKGDRLLENYDWFQGNSLAKACILISTKQK